MADKKLLEETIIARFQQLANIAAPAKGGVLTEGVKPASGRHVASAYRDDERNKRDAGKVEEVIDEEKVEEAMYDEAEGDEAGGEEAGGEDMDMAGDEMGAPMEGGDLESAVSSLVDALNGVLAAAGMDDKQVELDSGSEGGEDAPEMGGEEDMMAEAEEQKEGYGMQKEADKEDLEESIELVDDSLIEKLVQRVSARLVAEARKAKALEEGKKGGSASVRKAAGLGVTKHSPAPKKGKGSQMKGGTPFKGGKK